MEAISYFYNKNINLAISNVLIWKIKEQNGLDSLSW